MRIGYFFEGMLCREEAASALLAMALEGVASFRKYFFHLVMRGEEDSLSQHPWRVTVEEGQVDVRMEYGDTIVLIENKINYGAKRQGQLLGYYSREREQHPGARIIAVYLAPGQMGMDEVRRVSESKHPSDLVRHLSWENLAEYDSSPGDLRDAIVRDGLDEVQRMIDQGPIYILDGERSTIRNIVNDAFKELCRQTSIPLSRWSGKEFEQILTVRTNISFWLDAVFQVEDQPPFAPINVRDDNGRLQITVRSQFKLAGKVKKTSDIAQWWNRHIGINSLETAGLDEYQLQKSEWFVSTKKVCGDEKEIVKVLVETGVAVIATLSGLLASGGFKLVDN
jgi:hypothetical protein